MADRRPLVVIDGELQELPAGDSIAGALAGLSELIDDRVAALLAEGANITLTYDDTSNTLTIASSGGGGGLPAAQVAARILVGI